MKEESVPLCCCEFYDRNNERNHILACCCNCVDLDQAFECAITGNSIPQEHKERLMATLQDRLRVPWHGGAKQVAIDAVLPIFILPALFLVASINLWWTVFGFSTVTIFLIVFCSFLIRKMPRTKFFFVWTVTSIVQLYFIFEFNVIPLLEILLEENIALSVLIVGFVISVYKMRVRTSQFAEGGSEAEIGGLRLYNCIICQTSVPDKDHHCVWFNCCVGRHNRGLFISALFFGLAALLYSSNLTLTTVCHPFNAYKTILLPDDCSDAYQAFELAISFVAAVYSIFLALLVLVLFLHQLVLVSLGLTSKEWHKLPLSQKLCLGLTAPRPNNRGFFVNWKRVICPTAYHYGSLNQF